MESLRPSALILLIIVAGSAAALTVWLLIGASLPDTGQIQGFASVAAIAALAYRLPISFKRRIYLDVVAIAMAAILLFFFIVNAGASRRLMLTIALYEALVVAGALLDYSADDLSGRTTAISALGSVLPGLLGAWGGFFTRAEPGRNTSA